MRIRKRTSYIFPEVHNVILTADDVDAVFGSKLNRNRLSEMTPSQIYDAWSSSETEWSRFLVCEECNQIHSLTYEGCEEPSEFLRHHKSPVTVWSAAA